MITRPCIMMSLGLDRSIMWSYLINAIIASYMARHYMSGRAGQHDILGTSISDQLAHNH